MKKKTLKLVSAILVVSMLLSVVTIMPAYAATDINKAAEEADVE